MPSVVEHTQGEDKGGTDDAGREEEVSGHSGGTEAQPQPARRFLFFALT